MTNTHTKTHFIIIFISSSGGLAAPPTCYFPPLVPESFTSPYDATASVDVLKVTINSSQTLKVMKEMTKKQISA